MMTALTHATRRTCKSRDCFIRSDDDCIALKGLDFQAANSNVEHITVENCVLWCDRARVFLLGHESRAAFMRDVTLRNLDIIHFAMTPFLMEPGEDMCLENVHIENVRLYGEGQGESGAVKARGQRLHVEKGPRPDPQRAFQGCPGQRQTWPLSRYPRGRG